MNEYDDRYKLCEEDNKNMSCKNIIIHDDIIYERKNSDPKCLENISISLTMYGKARFFMNTLSYGVFKFG